MDLLTIGASLVSITVLTTNILKLVQNLANTKDPRVTLVRAKLMGERRRFANWMLFMRISNLDDLQRKIKPSDYKFVKEMVLDLEEFFDQADKKIKKLNLQPGRSLSSRARTLKTRFRWVYGEFDDLKLLVETLEALNSALYAIAEPPPKYGMTSEGEGPVPIINRRRPSEESHTNSAAQTESGVELQRSLPIKKPILNLYKMCLQALTFISSETKGTMTGRTAENVVFKIKTWATDFVDGSYPLDSILAREEDGEVACEDLRTVILGTMVDVALIEERFLGFLGTCSDDYNSRRLEELQLEVVAMLGTDDIVAIAVEHASPMLNEEDLSQAMVHAVKLLENAVNTLYDAIPALRTLRRERILEEEGKQAMLGEETDEVLVSSGVRSLTKSAQQITGEWLDQPFKSASEMEALVLKQEERARDAGESVDVVYSQLFKKEKERLQDLRDAIRMKGETTLSEEEREKVKEIVSRFAKGFADDSPKTNVAAVEISTTSKPEKLQLELDEKIVKRKLDSLSNAIEELRQIGSFSAI